LENENWQRVKRKKMNSLCFRIEKGIFGPALTREENTKDVGEGDKGGKTSLPGAREQRGKF